MGPDPNRVLSSVFDLPLVYVRAHSQRRFEDPDFYFCNRIDFGDRIATDLALDAANWLESK